MAALDTNSDGGSEGAKTATGSVAVNGGSDEKMKKRINKYQYLDEERTEPSMMDIEP